LFPLFNTHQGTELKIACCTETVVTTAKEMQHMNMEEWQCAASDVWISTTKCHQKMIVSLVAIQMPLKMKRNTMLPCRKNKLSSLPIRLI
jgi:hypothetical protein